MLQWNEQFETGHLLIDTQHRMLIGYINQLKGLSNSTNPSREEVELFFRFVEFLESYLLTHFREEEECMLRFRCPAHQENKKAHREFLDYFGQFKLQLEIEGYRPEEAKKLHEYCRAWIQRHILRIDVQLKPCQIEVSDSSPPE